MKTSFLMTLHDTAENRNKSSLLNRVEVMFDDHRNHLPDTYWQFVEQVPFGSKVRVTFEVVEENPAG